MRPKHEENQLKNIVYFTAHLAWCTWIHFDEHDKGIHKHTRLSENNRQDDNDDDC